MDQTVAQDDLFKEFKSIMKTGNAKEFSKMVNQTVTIKILGEECNCNKAQAEIILRDFFKKYPPVEYEGIHQGKGKDGSKHYAIGKYTHPKGVLRIYLLVKQSQGNFLIDTLDFSE
ncbi:MAG: DUF4783 domain-containing protein [Cytophagales bacterium]